MQLLVADAVASATLTNTTTETVLKSRRFAPNFWQVGTVVKARAAVRIPSTNSTDTLALNVRLGAVALTGTAIPVQPALDVANADVLVVDVELICRSVGTAGKVLVNAVGGRDAPGTVAGAWAPAEIDIDTTLASFLALTGVWSVASASNQAIAETFTVMSGAANG